MLTCLAQDQSNSISACHLRCYFCLAKGTHSSSRTWADHRLSGKRHVAHSDNSHALHTGQPGTFYSLYFDRMTPPVQNHTHDPHIHTPHCIPSFPGTKVFLCSITGQGTPSPPHTYTPNSDGIITLPLLFSSRPYLAIVPTSVWVGETHGNRILPQLLHNKTAS